MIKIKLNSLEKNINKLNAILNDNNNTQSDISNFITVSKGVYADEFEEVANELMAIQQSINTLLSSTISVLENAKSSYSQSDATSANLFEIDNKSK